MHWSTDDTVSADFSSPVNFLYAQIWLRKYRAFTCPFWVNQVRNVSINAYTIIDLCQKLWRARFFVLSIDIHLSDRPAIKKIRSGSSLDRQGFRTTLIGVQFPSQSLSNLCILFVGLTDKPAPIVFHQSLRSLDDTFLHFTKVVVPSPRSQEFPLCFLLPLSKRIYISVESDL